MSRKRQSQAVQLLSLAIVLLLIFAGHPTEQQQVAAQDPPAAPATEDDNTTDDEGAEPQSADEGGVDPDGQAAPTPSDVRRQEREKRRKVEQNEIQSLPTLTVFARRRIAQACLLILLVLFAVTISILLSGLISKQHRVWRDAGFGSVAIAVALGIYWYVTSSGWCEGITDPEFVFLLVTVGGPLGGILYSIQDDKLELPRLGPGEQEY